VPTATGASFTRRERQHEERKARVEGSVEMNTWAVILAAGDGLRVRAMTCDRWGHEAPKQYCPIDNGQTLLQSALNRARRVSGLERIVPVVASQHRRWWELELGQVPRDNILVQPANRGTAAGLLLPILWLARRDPDATVVILPSDHHVDREEAIEGALSRAIAAVDQSSEKIILLGIRPHSADPEYGWVLPCDRCALLPCKVQCFFEKPDVETAARLLGDGALLNSFILVARAGSMLRLYEAHLPDLRASFEQALGAGRVTWDEAALAGLYESIPTLDFSRDVLERAHDRLWVCPVQACGWSDLGTPERLVDHLSRADGNRDLGHQGAAAGGGPSAHDSRSRVTPGARALFRGEGCV
jgi:mannose-1-phosphate guanylyltransferase